MVSYIEYTGMNEGNLLMKELWNTTCTLSTVFDLPRSFEDDAKLYQNFSPGSFKNGYYINDTLQYYFVNANGLRVKPRHRSIIINDVSIKSITCSHSSGNITKRIFASSERVLVLYETLKISQIEELQKRKKIDDATRDKIRSALAYRNVRGAKESLANDGIVIPAKKIANQFNNVKSAVKCATGPQIVTLPSELVNRASEIRSASYSNEIVEGVREWRYVEIYEPNLSIFVHNLPKTLDVFTEREKVAKFDEVSKKKSVKLLDSIVQNYKEGGYHEMTAVLQIDTTFHLTDGYVTLIIGTMRHFKTRSSNKPKHVLLAAMIHSHKSSNTHQFFSDRFHSSCSQYDKKQKKTVTGVIHDGEKALSVYKSKTGVTAYARELNCNVHRRSNMTIDLGRKVVTKEIAALIFGKKIENILQPSLLSSLTKCEFETELRSIEEKIPPKVFRWLLDRKDELFERHSMRAKLEALLLQHYASTNILESLNNILKQRLNPNMNANLLAQRLSEYATEEHDALVKSIFHNKETTVSCDLFEQLDELKIEKQVSKLQRMGFAESALTFIGVPLNLRQFSTPDLLKGGSRTILDLGCEKGSNNRFFVTDSKSDKVYQVKEEDDLYICTSKTCQEQGNLLCKHIYRVFFSLCKEDRMLKFDAASRFYKNKTVKQNIRNTRTHRLGEKNKRKFSKFSKGNFVRHIEGIELNSEEHPKSENPSEDESYFDNESCFVQMIHPDITLQPVKTVCLEETCSDAVSIGSTNSTTSEIGVINDAGKTTRGEKSKPIDLEVVKQVPNLTDKEKPTRERRPKRAYSP